MSWGETCYINAEIVEHCLKQILVQVLIKCSILGIFLFKTDHDRPLGLPKSGASSSVALLNISIGCLGMTRKWVGATPLISLKAKHLSSSNNTSAGISLRIIFPKIVSPELHFTLKEILKQYKTV